MEVIKMKQQKRLLTAMLAFAILISSISSINAKRLTATEIMLRSNEASQKLRSYSMEISGFLNVKDDGQDQYANIDINADFIVTSKIKSKIDIDYSYSVPFIENSGSDKGSAELYLKESDNGIDIYARLDDEEDYETDTLDIDLESLNILKSNILLNGLTYQLFRDAELTDINNNGNPAYLISAEITAKDLFSSYSDESSASLYNALLLEPFANLIDDYPPIKVITLVDKESYIALRTYLDLTEFMQKILRDDLTTNNNSSNSRIPTGEKGSDIPFIRSCIIDCKVTNINAIQNIDFPALAEK